MQTIKNKITSLVLASVMLLTLIAWILPRTPIYAADGGTGGLQISSPKDGGEVNGYETIRVSWNKYTGVNHYILIVKDQNTNKEVFRDEDVGSSTKTYRIYSDDDVFTENGHEYKIYLAALDANGNVLNNGAAWNAIYVDNVLALDTPDITSHEKLSTHCTDEDLYVEWDPVDCATDYTITAKKLNGEPKFNDNEAGTNITFSRTDDCQIKINKSKLEVGKYYKIALCATNTKQGVSSDWASVYILMEESGYLDVSDCDDLDSASGSTGSFWIYSNLDWSITCNKSWLSWTKNQKDDTHTEIVVKATSANTGTSNRKATFTISADGKDDVYVHVYQLAPEIEFPSFSNVSVTENVTLGEDITWSATVNGNGSLLETVTVGIYSKQSNDSVYLRNTNIGKETYVLNGFVTTGSVVSGYDASGNAKTLDMSYAGEYTVTFHASTDASTNNYAKTDPVTVTVTEPVGTGILGDVNSDGNVDDIDQFIYKRYLDNIEGYTVDIMAADINGDGKATNEDLIILNNYLVSNNGYENLYDFYNQSGSSNKPIISSVSQIYYIKKGDELTIPFTLTAQGNGRIEKVTMKHNLLGTSFQAQSYECNVNSYSNSFSISGYPLDEVGSHTFVIYCRASNYTVTSNEIIIFTVYVTDNECSHTNYDHQYQRTVYTETFKTLVEHTYYHEYLSVCEDCGYEICTISGEGVTEGHKLTSKGYCLCGYIDTSGYAIWEGYNSSGKDVTVYSNPESTSQYGLIYANEAVTVLGECCGRYLIEYDLNSGGTKQGYVPIESISKANIYVGLYSLYIDDPYYYKDLIGLAQGGLIANYGDYFAVKIYDTNQKKYVSYTSDSKLSWKCENGNARIDDYGTLCIGDSNDKLVLYYNNILVSSIDIGVYEKNGYLQTIDALNAFWIGQKMYPNNHYVVTDLKSTYNSKTDMVDVAMKVYNRSFVVHAVAVYDAYGHITDYKFIESHWESFDIVDEFIDAFYYFPDLFNGSNWDGTSEGFATKTDIELSVPRGGYIKFLYPTDEDFVLEANIIQLLFAGLDLGIDLCGIKSTTKISTNIHSVVRNRKFMEIASAILKHYDTTTIVKGIINNDLHDGSQVARDIVLFLQSEDNNDMVYEILLALSQLIEDNAFEDTIITFVKKFKDIALYGCIPAKVLEKGFDAAGDSIQITGMVASICNMNEIDTSKYSIKIYCPVYIN